MIDLTEIEKIAAMTKRLLTERKKYDRIQSRWNGEITPKQAQKLNVELNWAAMEISKIETQLHVALVDAGLADIREPQHYAERTFRPSGWHTYNWVPPQPKGLVA